STKRYPTKKALTNRLFELYDASVAIHSLPSFATNVTFVSMELINDQYASKDSSLLEAGINLLAEILFNPNLDGSRWNQHDFLEQKRILKAHIENVYNQKGRYATQQLIKTMCQGEITAVSRLGDLDDLKILDEETMYQYYKEFIRENLAHIYVVGDFDKNTIMQALQVLYPLKGGDNPYSPIKLSDFIPKQVRQIEEQQKINQARLVMGFRMSIKFLHPFFIPELIFNEMFGGSFSSDLVQTVREKHSLCYSISSSINVADKIMLVHAGIDGGNSAKVQTLVLEILHRFQKGEFDLNNLQIAKDLMISGLNEIEDRPETMIDFIIKNDLLQRQMTVKEVIDQIKEVSPEQIADVAQGVYLDTVFLLTDEVNHD
ncbi:MAG TPA: pitrilysin family protein, partial [Bacilli bacterium]|nr:pitrilysin family protein [Bacilli bacterium]